MGGEALIFPLGLGVACLLAILLRNDCGQARADGFSLGKEGSTAASADGTQCDPDIASRQQVNEVEVGGNGLFHLHHDILERIWEHLSVVDLVRMSTVCKDWQHSIRFFTSAKRAAVAALVLVPDSPPVRKRLSELQIAFRWLKRLLLLQDGLTGVPLDRDAVLRHSYSKGRDGLLVWRSHVFHPISNGYEVLDLRDCGGSYRVYSGTYVLQQFVGEAFTQPSSSLDFSRRLVVSEAKIDCFDASISLRVEKVPFCANSAVVTLALCVHWPRKVHLVDGIVLALAQGMSVRLPGRSHGCRQGPLASRIELNVEVEAKRDTGQHWLPTLPGRKGACCFMKEGRYNHRFTFNPPAVTTPR